MSLERVGLSINNTVNDEREGFSIADTTGQYDSVTNPLGYGLPGGIASTDVTSVIIVVTNNSTSLYFTYTFTIVSEVITVVTLSIQGGTPTDITTEVLDVISSAWPFVEEVNEFDLWYDFGVTLPDFGDAVYTVTYEIIGAAGAPEPEDFDYTTSETFMVDCNVSCCNAKQYAALDVDCSCSDKAQAIADKTYAFLQAARFASEFGDTAKAIAALAAAVKLCDCDCSDC